MKTKTWIVSGILGISALVGLYGLFLPKETNATPWWGKHGEAASERALAQIVPFAAQKIVDDDIEWNLTGRPGESVRLFKGKRIKVHGIGATKDVVLEVNGLPVKTKKTNDIRKSWETESFIDLAQEKNTVGVKHGDDVEKKFDVYVFVDSDPITPRFTEVSSQAFFDDFTNAAGLTQLLTFRGRLVSARLTLPQPGNEIVPVVFKKTNGIFSSHLLDSEVVRTSQTGTTRDFVFRLPAELERADANDRFLLAFRNVVKSNGIYSHAYTPDPIQFKMGIIKDSLSVSSPQLKKRDGTTPLPIRRGVHYTKETSLKMEGSEDAPAGANVVVFREGSAQPIKATSKGAGAGWQAEISDLKDENVFRVAMVSGERSSEKSLPIIVRSRQTPPQVISVDPVNFAFRPGSNSITVRFNQENPITNDRAKFSLGKGPDGTTGAVQPSDSLLDEELNAITLLFSSIQEGSYLLTINTALEDLFGNPLGGNGKKIEIVKPVGADLPLVAPGIVSSTGPNVEFKEFLEPRKKPTGFNPGDHVESRVARLYYFRDAHRVAQILNREAKSYNRVAVDTRRRLAEQARSDADKKTLDRQVFERNAVALAEETRQAEHTLQKAQEIMKNAVSRRSVAQSQLDQANQILQNPPNEQQKNAAHLLKDKSDRDLNEAKNDIEASRERVVQAHDKVQSTRNKELEAKKAWEHAMGEEDLLRAEQFRREVAAMHEDPDTYAPGKPESQDPVRQVSISVIGESELHLRGPINGINVIREMINLIDSPAGQVRIAIHTIQVNGERQKKMEPVVGKIQDHVDQARFLTQQSALMLRKAVVKVASLKAEESRLYYPGDSQEARDVRYLYSFFGSDFINELRAQDSEFLRTGNKLLSIHSMDTTSLASALFVLALAKNEARRVILTEFRGMLEMELPEAERSYFEAGGCRKEKFFAKHKGFPLFAQNARFQSFFGFFNAEVMGDDTITPVQRDFIRLAQIFKSRLITEMEFKQRVMERALIEDRICDYTQELQAACTTEKEAKKALEKSIESLRAHQIEVLIAANALNDNVNKLKKDTALALSELARLAGLFETNQATAQRKGERTIQEIVEILKDLAGPDFAARQLKALSKDYRERGKPLAETIYDLYERARGKSLKLEGKDGKELRLSFTLTVGKETGTIDVLLSKTGDGRLANLEDHGPFVSAWIRSNKKRLQDLRNNLEGLKLMDTERKDLDIADTFLAEIRPEEPDKFLVHFDKMRSILNIYKSIFTRLQGASVRAQSMLSALSEGLSSTKAGTQRVYPQWEALKAQMVNEFPFPEVHERILGLEAGFTSLKASELAYYVAVDKLERSKRPLDHKKLLDMLIDEIHDKYVELLEGTRAHTANIDDYIKRVATALDDDFNTQFYFPTFREVRNAATSWDVNLGQIETTSILTNNRTYAKVDPQATMEFDLPRRDIMITEAMQGAKGLVDTYGALLQDPTFLSLVKMGSGMPTSMVGAGQAAGMSSVRSVLPGLSRMTDENFLTQNGPSTKSFGTPLDSLVPDPAIYKFETGTAYEIRPVIQPDGQSVTFHFNYMYTTKIREPVRADEKHLGRVKRHYIDTNVQLGNYELREISRYQVTLRASRTAKGVPLLEDIPGLGVLFRPMPSAESSLQENIILGQSTIFPTLFDLMGLRWAPAVADMDPLALTNADFIVRSRKRYLMNRVFDFSSSKVDEALQIPNGERRGDLYRSQETIPSTHPNGYQGPGMGLKDSHLQEGYSPHKVYPESMYAPKNSTEGHLNPYGDTDKRLEEKYPSAPPWLYGPKPGYHPGAMPVPGMAPPREELPPPRPVPGTHPGMHMGQPQGSPYGNEGPQVPGPTKQTPKPAKPPGVPGTLVPPSSSVPAPGESHGWIELPSLQSDAEKLIQPAVGPRINGRFGEWQPQQPAPQANASRPSILGIPMPQWRSPFGKK